MEQTRHRVSAGISLRCPGRTAGAPQLAVESLNRTPFKETWRGFCFITTDSGKGLTRSEFIGILSADEYSDQPKLSDMCDEAANEGLSCAAT
jgi:hypothetical protein